MADTPLRSLHLEASAGVDGGAPWARAEAGAHPAPGLGLYAHTEWRPRGWAAGAGVRYEVKW